MSIESAVVESLQFIEVADDTEIADAQATQLIHLFTHHPSVHKADITNAMRLLKGRRGRAAFPIGTLLTLTRGLSKIP